MARYNKIFRGPADKTKPQVREAVCPTAVLPGTALIINGATFAQAAANPLGVVYLAQDNYLAMRGVDDAWPAGDRVIGIHAQDDELYAVRIPTGTNLAAGDPLNTNAVGKFVKSTTGQRILFFALEAYNNTSGVDQLVTARVANSNLPAA